MAKLSYLAGSTSISLYVFIQASNVTTGAGLTGLAFNTAGLIAYEVRDRAAAAVVTLVTQTVTGAWSSGGFVEVDATHMPGIYRLDIPNNCLATGSDSCVVMLSGAANMATLTLEIELWAINPRDGVRAGMTALPNAAAAAVGGVPTLGAAIPNATAGASGGLLISGANAGTTTLAALTVTGATTMTGGLTANITGTLGTVTNLTNAPTSGDLTATMKASVTAAAWDATLASHENAGSTGAALAAAGGSGDPWATAIPGAYAAGTAGHRLGNIPDVAAGGAGGLFIAGANATTSITGALTADITGSISGNLGGSVLGSVVGNLGGDVLGNVDGVVGGGVNVVAINGSTSAAATLTSGMSTVGTGTVGAGSTTNSIVSSVMSPAGGDAGQFNGRSIIFRNDTATPALRGQARTITQTSAAATPTFTVVDLTVAPAAGDTFIVI